MQSNKQQSVPLNMQCVSITEDARLITTEQPVPQPSEHEILIQVAAAGLNRADLLQRRGLYPAPQGASTLPGLEVSGIVAAVGSKVTRFKIGDHVCALLPGGGYAEYAVAHEAGCLPKPDSLTWEEAAAMPEAIFTVWNNVFYRGNLKPSETVLIHGGSSGIGTMAIQMAKHWGSKVVATAGSDERAQACTTLGADYATSYKNDNWHQLLKDHAGGVDVILDVAGGSVLEGNLELLNLDGRMVTIAYMGDRFGQVDFTKIMRKRLTLTGSTLRGRSMEELAKLREAVEQHIWPIVTEGQIKPVIERVFALDKAMDAHLYMETGQHFGKIILKTNANIV